MKKAMLTLLGIARVEFNGFGVRLRVMIPSQVQGTKTGMGLGTGIRSVLGLGKLSRLWQIYNIV